MNQQNNTYWPANYTYTAIGATLIAGLAIIGFFGTQAHPPLWIFINMAVVAVFFIALNITSVRSLRLGGKSFVYKLFWMAWLTRVIYMFIIVYLAEIETGRSFYIGAIDATRYYRVGSEVAAIIQAGDFGRILPHLLIEYDGLMDNIGVPLVLGFVFSLTGNSVIAGKLFFTLMGTGTVILVYKTTRLLWDESVARLAGIMMAFFPIALFYSSVFLKEEFVVFLAMLAIFIVTKAVKMNRLGLWNLALLLFAITFIFLFRTAAGAVLVSLVVGMFFLNRFGGSIILSAFVGALVFGLFLYFMDTLGELQMYINRIEGYADYREGRIGSVARENPLATMVGIPVYVVLSFIAPFPSMVYIPIPWNHDATYYWPGGLIIWNFLIFFGLLGAWKAIRTQWNESLAVWGFAMGYTVILGLTALFTAVRFGYNVMPMFFILIAAGIHYRDEFPYWKIWLIGAVFLIFAWNVFRLAGRGMA